MSSSATSSGGDATSGTWSPPAAERFGWGSWVPLVGGGRNRSIPTGSGLYRVRVVDGPVVYVGQTGVSLRGRVGMLAGVTAEVMPYNDPHTAAPGLWALRHRDGCRFEVSVVPVDADRWDRCGLEALAITAHRVTVGGSPMLNFGGMPAGYRKSTGNNAALVAAGARHRGGPDVTVAAPIPSVSVHGPLDGPPTGAVWVGFEWSPWVPLPEATVGPAGAVGLYRIADRDHGTLVYIGQGSISRRLSVHRAPRRATQLHPDGPDRLIASWVTLDLPGRMLLEHENDLIAAHVHTAGHPPAAQFNR